MAGGEQVNWIEALKPILDDYMDGDDLPLDTDEVKDLCRVLETKINLYMGNIDEIEYEALLDLKTRKPPATTLIDDSLQRCEEHNDTNIDCGVCYPDVQ